LLATALWLAVGCASAPDPAPEPWLGGEQSRGLRVTILEYESAIEARDLTRLQRIWTPTEDQRAEIEDLFAGEPIELQIDWRSATMGTDLAIVDFDQTLRQGDEIGPKTRLTAAMTPLPAGGWRIAFLGEQEGAHSRTQAVEEIPAGGVEVTGPTKESAVGPLSWTSPGRRKSVASLQAEMVRRQGGEWVIVNLAPGVRNRAPRKLNAPSEAVGAELDRALLEYERAFEERDVDRLAQVWLMNPYEREALEELFAWSSMVAISIDALQVDMDGNRAHLDFDQKFVMSSRPRVATLARRAFERALAAHDAQGGWDIDTLRE
jgi:hypothetical protein